MKKVHQNRKKKNKNDHPLLLSINSILAFYELGKIGEEN